MRKIKEVLRLQARGMSNRKIAVCCGIGRSTVAEYLRRAANAGLAWPLSPGLSDTTIQQRLFPAPPTRASRDQTLPDWQWVYRELKRKGVTQFLLWQEYLEQHPRGYQYSWFCDLYREWRGKLDVVMRQDHRAGEKLFVDMQADEILTEVLIPARSEKDHCRSAFWKLRRRGSIDFAVLSVAAAVWTDANDVVTRAAVYLGAVGSSPVPVEVEALLVGQPLSEELIMQIAQRAQKAATPMDNTDFAAAWRGKMANNYTHAALNEIAGLPVRCAAPRHGLTVV